MLKHSDQTVHWILASSIIPSWQVMRKVCVCVRERALVLTHTVFVCVIQIYPFMRFKGHVKAMSCADAPHLSCERVIEEKRMQPFVSESLNLFPVEQRP